MLHLEISSKCALKCPACSRTLHPGTFPITEMDLAVVRNALDTTQSFSSILLCGDHGDPIYHSRYHEIVDLAHQMHPGTPVVTATNGAHRTMEWWKKTAQVLAPIDVMVFGIDGLEDTSHLHRIGGDWNSAMDALKLLRASSQCEIRWQWILFNYNEHQLKDGLTLARELGVDFFEVTRSFRNMPKRPEFEPPRSDDVDLSAM